MLDPLTTALTITDPSVPDPEPPREYAVRLLYQRGPSNKEYELSITPDPRGFRVLARYGRRYAHLPHRHVYADEAPWANAVDAFDEQLVRQLRQGYHLHRPLGEPHWRSPMQWFLLSSGEPFRGFYLRLLKSADPYLQRLALQIAVHAPRAQFDALARLDVLPLLDAGDPDVRADAALLLGRFGPDAPAEAPRPRRARVARPGR